MNYKKRNELDLLASEVTSIITGELKPCHSPLVDYCELQFNDGTSGDIVEFEVLFFQHHITTNGIKLPTSTDFTIKFTTQDHNIIRKLGNLLNKETLKVIKCDSKGIVLESFVLHGCFLNEIIFNNKGKTPEAQVILNCDYSILNS